MTGMEVAMATATTTSNDIACAGVALTSYRGPGCGQGAGGNAKPAEAVESQASDGSHDANDVVVAKGINCDRSARKHGCPLWSTLPPVPANNDDSGDSAVAIVVVVNGPDSCPPGPTAAAGLTDVSQ